MKRIVYSLFACLAFALSPFVSYASERISYVVSSDLDGGYQAASTKLKAELVVMRQGSGGQGLSSYGMVRDGHGFLQVKADEYDDLIDPGRTC